MLRLHVPGQELRVHKLQLKIPHAATKIEDLKCTNQDLARKINILKYMHQYFMPSVSILQKISIFWIKIFYDASHKYQYHHYTQISRELLILT